MPLSRFALAAPIVFCIAGTTFAQPKPLVWDDRPVMPQPFDTKPFHRVRIPGWVQETVGCGYTLSVMDSASRELGNVLLEFARRHVRASPLEQFAVVVREEGIDEAHLGAVKSRTPPSFPASSNAPTGRAGWSTSRPASTRRITSTPTRTIGSC